MWYRIDNDYNTYVLADIDGLCLEYCTEYHDMEGSRLFVPDSLHEKFSEEFDCEYGD